MRIPVIVMGELEGLGKMKDHEASSPEHAATVREASRAALKAGKPLMIVTSEGGEA